MAMRDYWQLQEAKAKFSRVIEKTLSEGPQIITRRGEAVAAIIPISQWERLVGAKESFFDFCRRYAGIGDSLEMKRAKDLPRRIRL